MLTRFFALFFALSAAALATSSSDSKIRVSSFSTILTEIAEKVGGDHVTVYSHVKPGSDPHEFEPKAEDMKVVSDAQLIILSAKNMESYVPKLREAAGAKAAILEVGDHFPSLKMKAEGDQTREVDDPHWWHSIANVEKAVEVVRDALIKIDPQNQADYTANAAKYVASLSDLQKWVRSTIAKLPRDQRKLVTSHDAFQYFARDYGFTIYPIEGISPEDEPSSKKVADLIDLIKKQHVKSVFPESIENPKVLQEITRETGARIGEKLVADGLGTDDASTYEGMMRHNVNAIVAGLK